MKVKEFKELILGNYIVCSARTGNVLEKIDWKRGSTDNLEVTGIFTKVVDKERYLVPTVCLYAVEES